MNITELSLKALTDALRSRELSSREATEAYLAKIDETDSQVGAYLTVTKEEALAAAAAIDAMKIRDIVGTLAGDDNILVILRTNEDAEKFCEMVAGMLS